MCSSLGNISPRALSIKRGVIKRCQAPPTGPPPHPDVTRPRRRQEACGPAQRRGQAAVRFATESVRPSLQRVASRLTCSPTRRASVRVSVRHFDGEKGEEVCHFCSICSRRNTNATAHVRSERDCRRPRKTQVQSVRLPPEILHRLKPNVAGFVFYKTDI